MLRSIYRRMKKGKEIKEKRESKEALAELQEELTNEGVLDRILSL